MSLAAFLHRRKTAAGAATAPKSRRALEITGSRLGKKIPEVRTAAIMRSALLAPRIPIRNRLNFEFMGKDTGPPPNPI
jgi:hypothetical protein